MEDFKPASEKQIALLKKMGIEVFEGITMQEASALINQHKQNEAPKNEVVSAGGNKPAPQTASFSTFMSTVGTKLVANTLQDKERQNQFIANIVSAVSSNKQLAECDQVSVLSAALQAEAMKFPINNSLGYVYLVPFNDKKSGMKKAQFQIGYKGYIQLAIRSGQYKDINVVEVKEGEVGEFNPLDGQQFNWIQNYELRKSKKTVGYVGQFELTTGFKKQFYMSYDEMLDHADEYSQAFNKSDYARLQRGEIPEKEMWKYSSFWYKNFDEMAKKTILRQLLSKWGIMSVEMQDAYVKDQATLEGEKPNYVDSKDFQFNYDEMEQEQDNLNASINVDENGIIQD
ncbi:MAG: recombinase RecT [Bacilli bacterium]|nr:recombinase RecT [Bacilli bacterium]